MVHFFSRPLRFYEISKLQGGFYGIIRYDMITETRLQEIFSYCTILALLQVPAVWFFLIHSNIETCFSSSGPVIHTLSKIL